MANSNIRSRSAKSTPKRPKDFPLTPRGDGRWCKKVKGKMHYFIGTADEALNEWLRVKDDILAGRTPREKDDNGYSLKDLANDFLNAKLPKLANGELSAHTFSDYQRTCAKLIKQFGGSRRVDDLRPDDFEKFRHSLGKNFSATTLSNEINRTRIILKYASDQQKIGRPVVYGQSFAKPAARTLRKARNEAGPKLFEADELRRIIKEADPWLRAMVLLGINGGLGNTDIANLPQSAIAAEGWLNYPRPKTEIRRRIPLWKETREAITKAIETRPEPKDNRDANLVFITVQGNRWTRMKPSKTNPKQYVSVNTLGARFGALLKRLKINGRKGLGFYTLRHTFETIAGESKDQVAVDAVMGHVDSSMAAVYRERISDDRLRDVTEHVRRWLNLDAE